MMRIVAIAGSLRRQSLNRALLNIAAHRAPAGMSIEINDDLRSLPLFDEDLEAASEPEAVRRLREKVVNADGALIATPEYNQSIPGVLKNAIDWLSRRDALAAKPVAIAGVTAGRWGTRLAQAALRQTLTATEAVVMPSPALYLRESDLADPRTLADLDAFLSAFVRWVGASRLVGGTV